jgi:aryl-alcohol dehydrogenase-like predicted oxidoreductase
VHSTPTPSLWRNIRFVTASYEQPKQPSASQPAAEQLSSSTMVARTLNAARVYLGTMNFGWAQASSVCDAPVAAEMLKRFAAYGGNRLDTARIYANGKGEGHVREAIARSGISDWRLGSKAAPSSDKGLSPEGIHGQFDSTRNALEMDGALDEYYLHQPDPQHSLVDTLQTMDVLVGMNVVREVGLSNFHVDEVKRAFDICDEYGLAYPSVYQGLYNPLNRLVEDDLLPFLREKNVRFVAYNGLAAGLLTGKHRQGTDVLAGRCPGGNYPLCVASMASRRWRLEGCFLRRPVQRQRELLTEILHGQQF